MHENLKRLDAELAVILVGLDARRAQLTPLANPNKWNIQEIVEHLLLSYRSTIGVVQVRLDKGTPTQAKPSLQQRVGQFGLISLGRFPYGRKAPAIVCPTSPTSLRTGKELMRSVHENLLAMDEGLTRAEEMFGRQRFASHTVLGPLSAEQWTKFHLVHGKHHVKQIQGIRRDYKI